MGVSSGVFSPSIKRIHQSTNNGAHCIDSCGALAEVAKKSQKIDGVPFQCPLASIVTRAFKNKYIVGAPEETSIKGSKREYDARGYNKHRKACVDYEPMYFQYTYQRMTDSVEHLF